MKRSRPIPRFIRRILFVIAFIIVVAAGCGTWVDFCSQPEEIALPDEIIPLLQDNRDKSVEIISYLYRVVSRELAWHGNSSLYFLSFSEACRIDNCSIVSLDMILEFEHHLACSWATSRFNHSLVSVKVANFSVPHIETSISELRWGDGGYQPSPVSFVAEMAWVRNRALQTLPNYDRQRSQFVRLNYWGILDDDEFDWLMHVRLASSAESQSPAISHPSPLEAIRAQLTQDWQ